MMIPTILPSVMAKNQQELDDFFSRLKGVVKHLHLDVVDGKFAQNHSLDFAFHLSKDFTYSTHVMTKNPEQWIGRHMRLIDLCIPQFEELRSLQHYIVWMRKRKKKVAVALKPETSVHNLKPLLSKIDYVLILTVHPGFYGSEYLPEQLRKIQQIKSINPKVKIMVDGGMNPQTIVEAARAGADHFISGSYTTKAEDPRKALQSLLDGVKKGRIPKRRV